MKVLLIVLIGCTSGHLSAGSHARPPTDDDLRELVRKATDGCANVFVDAGANIGVHTRILFEPAKYPRSHFTRVFARTFGAFPDVAQLTCSLGFEPNPKHVSRHKALQRAYERMGWRHSFFPFALGANTSGELVFYENANYFEGGMCMCMCMLDARSWFYDLDSKLHIPQARRMGIGLSAPPTFGIQDQSEIRLYLPSPST